MTVSTIEGAARIAASLPGVTEGERHGNMTWFVGGKAFAWDRPFSKADIRRFGEVQPPPGPILAVGVADLDEKEAVLASSSEAVFTIPHLDGYAAVLIHLERVSTSELEDLITDAWSVHAPPEARDQHNVR